MAQADRDNITITWRKIPLSELFSDPALRAAFRAAEDSGLNASITFALPPQAPRTLDGGAVAELTYETETV